MMWLLGFVTLAAILGQALAVLEMKHSRESHDSVYQMLLAERDLAREESATLRKALFPQLNRVEKKPVTSATPVNFPLPTPRKPFRHLFKDLVRQNNKKQMGTDKMAAAIDERK